MITEKQQEYLNNCNRLWNIKSGATGAGKSFIDYSYVIPKRIMSTRGEGLIVLLGHTRDTLDRNILQPMRGIWGTTLVPDLKTGNNITLFGKKCYVLGADKSTAVAKIQGQTIEYAYGDEITTWVQPVFEMLKSRLRCEHSVFDGTCNPSTPQHWLKQFIDSPANVYHQKYTIDDNPTLPEKFVKELKLEYTGTVYYRRYILGEWTKAEGLIYPVYSDAYGKIDHDKPIEAQAFSIDYGTLNAFACILWQKQGGVWYGDRAYYYSGRNTGKQKTDGEYLADIEREFADIIEPYMSQDVMNKIEVIIDPSAASFITLLQRQKWCKVRQADNAVLDGIRETATAMRNGLIKLNPNVKEYEAELGGYVWDESTTEERPVKVDDHLCDAIRYFVKTKRIAKPKRQYNPILGM